VTAWFKHFKLEAKAALEQHSVPVWKWTGKSFKLDSEYHSLADGCVNVHEWRKMFPSQHALNELLVKSRSLQALWSCILELLSGREELTEKRVCGGKALHAERTKCLGHMEQGASKHARTLVESHNRMQIDAIVRCCIAEAELEDSVKLAVSNTVRQALDMVDAGDTEGVVAVAGRLFEMLCGKSIKAPSIPCSCAGVDVAATAAPSTDTATVITGGIDSIAPAGVETSDASFLVASAGRAREPSEADGLLERHPPAENKHYAAVMRMVFQGFHEEAEKHIKALQRAMD